MDERHTRKTATPFARQVKITDMVRSNKRVTVNELARQLAISKETVRRDLTALAKAGKVVKFHGGATLPTLDSEGSFSSRMGENVIAKAQIAARASRLISPGETIFVDTGSTTYYFAEKISEIVGLTVITNSAEVARIVTASASPTSCFLLGGQYSGSNRQTVGNMATGQVASFQAHHAIITVGAVGETGVMDFSIEEAQMAQAMIRQAKQVTVIADSSKFNKIASFKVCDLRQITNLVCEEPPTGNLEIFLRDAGVRILLARPRSEKLYPGLSPVL